MSNIEKVRDFVVDTFLFGEGSSLTGDTSFLDGGILDSVGMLEIITFLEDTFKITIKDNELVPENLDSLNNISRFLDSKLKA